MENKIMNGGTSAAVTHTPRTPTPRTFNGKLYYCASDVAKIIGVDRSRVVRWNNELWHGAQWFTADLKTHDGVYLYEVERVMQLAAVYRPNWTRGSYEPPIENAGDKKVRVSQKTIATIKKVPPMTMERKGIIRAADAFKSGYVCPFCGSHEDGRGSLTANRIGEFFHWECNKCGGEFDNIDLFAKSFGLNRDADLIEICQKVCEMCAITFELVDDATTTEVDIPALPMKEISTSTSPSYSPDFTLQRQSLDDAKLALKSIPPDQLGLQFLQPAKNGGYICPNPDCRDGSGRDGTGMTHYSKSDGTHEYYCGKCAHGYDNVAILGFYFGLDPKTQFKEILQKAANYFNLPAIYDARGNISTVATKELTEEQKRRIYDEIVSSHKNLQAFVDGQGGTWRGLSFDTLNKFMVGFNPHWYARPNAPRTPRVIIPTSFTHYLARLLGKIENFKIPAGVHLDEKEHRGHKEIFNFRRALIKSADPIIFVVEGEIDTMSIYQASEGKINVISIGGSDLATNIERQLQTLTTQKNFVVMLDNDDTGKKKAPILAAKLQALGHKAIVRFLSETYNDANDFLQADAEGLSKRLRALYDDVKAAFDTLPAPPEINAPAPPTREIQPVTVGDKSADSAQASEVGKEQSAPADEFDTDINEYAPYAHELTKKEIKAALKWIRELKPDDITAKMLGTAAVIRKVALAKVFKLTSYEEEFYSKVKQAQQIARNRLKENKTEMTAPLTDEERLALTNLLNYRVGTLRQAVKDAQHQAKWDAEQPAAKQHAEEIAQAEAIMQANAEREKAKMREQVTVSVVKEDPRKRLKELKAQPPSPERDKSIIDIIRNLCDWKLDKEGNPVYVKSTAENVNLIFDDDPVLDGLVGYDEFRQLHVFLKTPPWRNDNCKGKPWTDDDESIIYKYLRTTYKELKETKLIYQTLIEYGRKNSFHVVKDFFNGLPQWDGTPRAETLFIDKLAVEDTPYARAVTKNWLIAAVARIFNPGCSYDLAPILLGKQGIGKSLILKKLGGKWYGALLDDAGDSHALDAIDALWIVEIKEMASMKKDSDNNKRFIDNSTDTRRKAYDRRATPVDRHCVFMCSTNREQCLIDQTGNRRYPILQCRKAQNDAAAVQAMTDDEIKQIWAEVYHLYLELFKDKFDDKLLVLKDEFKTQVDAIAAEHLRDDGIQGEIQAYLDTPIPEPLIWDLFNRDERRDFFINGELKIDSEVLRARFKFRAGNRYSELKAKFEEATTSRDGVVKNVSITRSDQSTFWQLTFYGAQLREHVAAIEIYTEYFANSDKRKTMPRISEALEKIDDWQKGKRIGHDPVYGNLMNVYYRKTEQDA